MRTTSAWRSVAGSVSPRHRAWSRLLAGLTFDPDQVRGQILAPDANSFLMCGSPRSGTALLVAALFQPPSVVTVMEPWDSLRMAPQDLFRSLRSEIATSRRIGRGRLDIDSLDRDGSVSWCRDGERPYELPELDPEFLLGVKLPAFWRYLDILGETKFLVCLRHPLEVIRSYANTGGRLREGLDYDVPFNRRMNDVLTAATDDHAVRRVLLYDYIHERIIPHLDRPNVLAVRYERWFTDPEQQLADVAAFLGVRPLSLRVRLQSPRSRDGGDPEDVELVRKYCSTATALGYEL